MFALVDVNAFYCSAEQVFRPAWRGKPLIVLSNNDGCIVAANRQAKEAGIEKFSPYFKMRARCEAAGVIVCSSNYALYGDLSEKMMQVIGRFAPSQHIYSIDESFLSFEGICKKKGKITDLRKEGQALRLAVWKECRLPVCVGMGTTLTLAKVANHAAKKIRTYHGVCVLDTSKEREWVLRQMDVGDIWGIGRRLCARLKIQGIHNAWQLSCQKPALMRKAYSVEMERIIRELNGENCKHWDAARADKQQIFSTRSMSCRLVDENTLREALSKHAAIAAKKLRAQGSLCSVFMVFAANSPYDEKPKSFKYIHRFPFPTNDTLCFTHAVSALVPSLYQEGVRYYKVGVGLLDLVSAQSVQPDLFDSQTSNPALMAVFDGINQRYGNGSLFLAAQGIQPKWGMRRAFLSPQYTTCWKDLPLVRC